MSSELSDDKLREILSGCEGVQGGPWKPEGYVVLGDWHASGAIAKVWGNEKAFATTRHLARLDPATVNALVTELLERRSDALRTPSKEGDGWQAVPVEPTEAMYHGNNAPTSFAYFIRFGDFVHSYRAMLAAAPPVPDTRAAP